MKTLFKIILSISLVASILFLLSSIQGTALGSTLNLAGTTYNIAGNGITSSATSVTLQSLTVPQTSALITDAMLSDTFYITLEPGSKTKQEIVSCTTVTQNAGGTATLSGCSRGLLPFTPYTASTTYAFVHAGGSQVIFSDPPQLFNLYTAKANNEDITGFWTFPAPISTSTSPVTLGYASSTVVSLFGNQTIAGVKTFTGSNIINNNLTFDASRTINMTSGGVITGLAAPSSGETTKAATVGYANALVASGVATATPTVSGKAKLSVTAVDADDPIVVGDNDPRVNSTNAVYIVSTSTASYPFGNGTYATTTLRNIPFATSTIIEISASSTPSETFMIFFNDDYYGQNYSYNMELRNSGAGATTGGNNQPYINSYYGVQSFIRLTIDNDTIFVGTSTARAFHYRGVHWNARTGNGEVNMEGNLEGGGVWSGIGPINSVSVRKMGGVMGTTTIRAILVK